VSLKRGKGGITRGKQIRGESNLRKTGGKVVAAEVAKIVAALLRRVGDPSRRRGREKKRPDSGEKKKVERGGPRAGSIKGS